MPFSLRPLHLCLFASLSLLARAAESAADTTPTEWIDPDTGHRVIRLSQDPGTASLYFHQNAYTPDGTRLVVTTTKGIATIDLATRAIEPVVEGRVNVIVVGRKSGDVYYSKRESGESTVFATNLITKATRQIVKLARGGVSSLNADETLLLGTYGDGPDFRNFAGEPPPSPDGPSMSNTSASQPAGGGRNAFFQANYQAKRPDGTPMTFAEAKEFRLHEQLARIRANSHRTLFTVDIKTGEIKTVLEEKEWLGHLQFSPTDPTLIMFCHEGPWHEVDRIWTVHADGSGLKKIHARTMNMEIAGHEFFSGDGKTIWYDLQTPRGEDFWVAGYALATGQRTWWHLQRDEWSVHFNVAPDSTLFCGDGGDDEMVAHAKNGKWIYLFRPTVLPNVAGVPNPESADLIKAGSFQAERLVNMSKHDYRLEPNVSFTPDMKWIVFRSNMTGAVHTYAVEIAKAK